MTYEVVYWELTRLSRIVTANSTEEAIVVSEAKRVAGDWDDCEEESEGTNGVERVYLHHDGQVTEVCNSGTIAGMIDPMTEEDNA